MEKQPSYFQPDKGVSRFVDPFVPDGKESHYLQLADAALQNPKENHPVGRKHELPQGRRVWNGVQKNNDVRPLCYEHHVEMGFSSVPRGAGKVTQMPCYVCPKPDCFVGYSSRQGYFTIIRRTEYTQRNMTPCVSCSSDGRLMYLAQVRPEKRSFRLWRCPECSEVRTTGEFSPAW